jgi:ribosomal protein L37AE/L43A
MKLFRHLRQKYLRLSASASSHHQKHFDYCPHCEEKTPWMTRVLQGYYRCLQCGNDPLTVGPNAEVSGDSAAESAGRAQYRKSA